MITIDASKNDVIKLYDEKSCEEITIYPPLMRDDRDMFTIKLIKSILRGEE